MIQAPESTGITVLASTGCPRSLFRVAPGGAPMCSLGRIWVGNSETRRIGMLSRLDMLAISTLVQLTIGKQANTLMVPENTVQ